MTVIVEIPLPCLFMSLRELLNRMVNICTYFSKRKEIIIMVLP